MARADVYAAVLLGTASALAVLLYQRNRRWMPQRY